MSDQVLWFATRGFGVVSLVLSTAVVCLGFLIVVRWSRPGWPRFLTAELHRRVALLSIVFVGLHVATAILDPFTSLGLAAAIVPLASSYRPVAVAAGVISVDLVLAVIVTSLLRERLGHRAWRAVHWLAYGAWPLAVLHSLTAGSDAFAPWMVALTGLCVLAVVASLAWRAVAGASQQSVFPTVVATPSQPTGIARRRAG
jgi:DMSO/TMAO reductase YedYZ heme-binding membrane subunit